VFFNNKNISNKKLLDFMERMWQIKN
jgi:hypothetical protein